MKHNPKLQLRGRICSSCGMKMIIEQDGHFQAEYHRHREIMTKSKLRVLASRELLRRTAHQVARKIALVVYAVMPEVEGVVPLLG